MIRQRTTASVWTASVEDEAMVYLEPDLAYKYGQRRILSEVGIDDHGRIKGTPGVLTLFKVRPIKKELIHLIDNPDILACRIIFSYCVTDIRNMDGFQIERDDNQEISDKTVDIIGLDIVKDIAGYCIDQRRGSNGNTVPFSLPDGWRLRTARLRAAHATYAIIANANDPITNSKSETSSMDTNTQKAEAV